MGMETGRDQPIEGRSEKFRGLAIATPQPEYCAFHPARLESRGFSKLNAENFPAGCQRCRGNPVSRDFAPMNLSLSAAHPLF
jgi:hypothetical protein